MGAGNVATHLGLALQNAGLNIEQVYSRTTASAKSLAKKLKTDYTVETDKIGLDSDLYILAVSDDAIPGLVAKLKTEKGLVVHTSGSVNIKSLTPASKHTGVFYPLQTFSKSRKAKFKNIPICIEANSKEDLALLKKLAGMISGKVYEISSEKRKTLHLAAVFASNFSNYMFSVAEEIVEDANLDFDILRPLIKETAEKVMTISPQKAQTGPAQRHDESVMLQHLKMLEENEPYELLYEYISSEIMKMNEE